MEMREWLSIIVIVAIVLIVLDGFRRKRKERNPVRMKLEKNLPSPITPDEDESLAELPGGRARTIPRDQYQTTSQPKDKAGDGKHGRKRKMEERVRFEEKVPVLMDSVNIAPEDVEAKEARDVEEEVPLYADTGEPVAELQQEEIRAGRRGADDDGYDDDDEDDFVEDEDDYEDEDEDEDEDDYEDDEEEDEYRSGNFDGNDEFDDEYDEDEDEDEDDFDDEDEDDEDDLDDEDEYEEDYDEEDAYAADRGGRTGGRVEPTFSAEDILDEDEDSEAPFAAAPLGVETPRVQRSQLTRDLQGELALGAEDYDSGEIAATNEELGAAEEVIVINVMARKGEAFLGKELLPVLLSQGMRLGDMSIFHRHADSSGNGPVIFSMANMVKPGTFDMGSMDEFSTPGVSFFQQLPGPLNNMKNFERMLNTATTLRDALDGELKDENRSVLTRQTIEHCRQRIRDFELRQELARKQLH